MEPIVTEQPLQNTHTKTSPPGEPILGTHLSVAGGLELALVETAALGCQCVQIFVKNQRQWQAPPLTREQIERFKDMLNATCVAPVVAHASYLLNLASPDDRARQRSRDAMIDELERCEALGVDYLVFHPGAHMHGEGTKALRHGGTEENNDMQSEPQAPARGLDPSLALRVRIDSDVVLAGIERIAKALDEVHRRCAGVRTMILLETTAGQGTAIGWRFEHIRGILDRVSEVDQSCFGIIPFPCIGIGDCICQP